MDLTYLFAKLTRNFMVDLIVVEAKDRVCRLPTLPRLLYSSAEGCARVVGGYMSVRPRLVCGLLLFDSCEEKGGKDVRYIKLPSTFDHPSPSCDNFTGLG